MGKPPSKSEAKPPEDFPQTTPPAELYAMTDIRVVMIELAKLSTLVERLIKDVAKQEGQLDALRHQATYLKGGLAVAVVALGLFGWFISETVSGKLQAVLTALSHIK